MRKGRPDSSSGMVSSPRFPTPKASSLHSRTTPIIAHCRLTFPRCDQPSPESIVCARLARLSLTQIFSRLGHAEHQTRKRGHDNDAYKGGRDGPLASLSSGVRLLRTMSEYYYITRNSGPFVKEDRRDITEAE